MKVDLDSLPHLTNAKIATIFDGVMEEWHAATKAVFAMALHGQERFLTILERIGAGDAVDGRAVAARFQSADAARTAIEAEARSRVGSLGMGACYAYTLRKSPRYVRIPRAKAA